MSCDIANGKHNLREQTNKNTEEFNYTCSIVEQRRSDIDVDRTLLMWGNN